MKKLLMHTASVLVLVGPASGAALAADGYTGIHPSMTSGLSIAAGAFFSKTDNEYRLKSGPESGTTVDTDDLGIDDTNTVPFGTLRWRFTDRWRVEGNYFSVDTDGKIRTSEQIDWGDLDFEVGAELKTKAKTKIVRGAVGYSFIKRDQVELGAGVGLHYLDWETTLKGNATIDGEPVISASRKSSVDGWAPNLALFGGYAFNNRWLLSGRVDWISAEVGNIDGSLWRFGGSVIYQPFEHVGFGAGYDWVSGDIDYEDDGEKASIDADYYGPTLFVSLTFL